MHASLPGRKFCNSNMNRWMFIVSTTLKILITIYDLRNTQKWFLIKTVSINAQPSSFADPWGTEDNVKTCQYELCALSSWNKVILFWVPSYCGIQGNNKVGALPGKGSSSPFLSPEPPISILPHVSTHMVKEWLTENYSEYWAAVQVWGSQRYPLEDLPINSPQT
jgi:hypothetical protein